MKIKEGFLLREVAGQTVVIPVSTAMELNAMITLNETGTFLWKAMQEETTEEALVQALLGEYDVDEATATEAVKAFTAKLKENGIAE